MFYIDEINRNVAYVVATILTSAILFKIILGRKSNAPPGPIGFPIVGHLPLLGKNPAKTLMKMGEKYGDVFSIRMGSWPTLVLNSRDVIREALVDSSDVFLDRPPFFSFRKIDDMRSLGFGFYNEVWGVKHKIAVKVLKQFATSKKNPIEEIINNETDLMLTKFLNFKGDKFDPHEEIVMAVGSVIYQLSFGKDKNCRADENFVNMVHNNNEFVEMTGAGNPVDVLPWLSYILPWKISNFDRMMRQQNDALDQVLQERLRTFDQNNMGNLSDGLISAASQHDTDPNSYHGVTKADIYHILRELIGAGFESVSTTLDWAILYLSANQTIQKKIQAEIDDIIGARRPTLMDQQSLPYLKATILEINRICAVVPLNIPYATKRDIYFRNFHIKKGTVVLCNNYATAMDPKKWKNPDTFLPERFLDKNKCIVRSKAEEAIIFGIGRRRCIGEFLAQDELFLFLVNIYQRCKTQLSSKPDFEGISMLTYKPKPYEITLTSRL